MQTFTITDKELTIEDLRNFSTTDEESDIG
jgi:hypothetical protein